MGFWPTAILVRRPILALGSTLNFAQALKPPRVTGNERNSGLNVPLKKKITIHVQHIKIRGQPFRISFSAVILGYFWKEKHVLASSHHRGQGDTKICQIGCLVTEL